MEASASDSPLDVRHADVKELPPNHRKTAADIIQFSVEPLESGGFTATFTVPEGEHHYYCFIITTQGNATGIHWALPEPELPRIRKLAIDPNQRSYC